tara:strand:- start:165 stop:386 length:222 start_codon:yes stop_codon:yes gene_type:complete
MSAELKKIDIKEEDSLYKETRPQFNETPQSQKVNLNDLVNRLKTEKRKEKKHNLIVSVAAVSAVTVFGVILTL